MSVRMNSNIGLGYHFEFVENEVYLVTTSPDDLTAFQSRWPSTVLFQIALPSSDTNIEPTFIYLLNVDPSMANTRRLDKDLAQLDSRLHGQHQVSSEAGLKLLALVAGEIRREGLRLGINVLLKSADFAETYIFVIRQEKGPPTPVAQTSISCGGTLVYPNSKRVINKRKKSLTGCI